MMTARWTSIALIASGALNLFLIGTGVTLIALGANGVSDRSPERPNLRAAAMSLAPEHRRQFNALLRAEGKSVHDANRRARALRIATWSSLATATFDPATAKADLARARALNQESRGKVEDGVLDFAAGLPAVERAGFGEAMRRAAARQSRVSPPANPAAKAQ
jgi:uncharacterized membrane protein